MTRGKKRILIVAGEASADLHGSRVAAELLRRSPEVEIQAMGGEYLRQAGAEVLIDSSKLAVVGLTEVLGKLGALYRARRSLKRIIEAKEIDLVILIDFPDFNLPLALAAKRAAVPVLYYISPQVWAWRAGRTAKIARRVTRMAVIFPFEVPFYREKGLEAEFVGHPLMDVFSEGASPVSSRPAEWHGNPVVALLPGSRTKEVKSLLPEMIRAADLLALRMPGARFLLAVAPGLEAGDIENSMPPHRAAITAVRGRTYEAISAADLVIVASGTATLETAILQKPMIIVYRVSSVTYFAARAMIRVKWIGLVNLVAGRALAPELIQGEATGERMAEEAMRILGDEKLRREMVAGLALVKEKLGAPGAAGRVAKMALDMITEKVKDQNPNVN